MSGATLWLVRSARNEIRGPFPAPELKQMLQAGGLAAGDEVCSAGGYWFYLRESEEVARHFGPEATKFLFPSMEETTETQISRGKTAPSATPPANASARAGLERAGFLQAVIWILVVLAGLILGVVLKLLFSAP